MLNLKKILLPVLVVTFCSMQLVAPLRSAHANEGGEDDINFLELGMTSPWTLGQNTTELCRMTASFDRGYSLHIDYDKYIGAYSLNMEASNMNLDETKIYSTALYFDASLFNNYPLQPLSSSMLSMILPAPDRFLGAAQQASVMSIGFGDTLHIFDISAGGITPSFFDACFTTDAIDVAAIEGNRDLMIGDDAMSISTLQEPYVAPVASSAPMGFSSIPYPVRKPALDAFSIAMQAPSQLSLATTNEMIEATNSVATSAVSSSDEFIWLPASDVDDLFDVAPISVTPTVSVDTDSMGMMDGLDTSIVTLDDGTQVSKKPLMSDPVPEIIINDIDLMPMVDIPVELQNIEAAMTGNNNFDEAQELIDSLYVQLDLLEKEKEALKNRVAENVGPLSVIRSCGRERTVIEDLKGELNNTSVEKYELIKRKEILQDQVSQCEQLTFVDMPLDDSAAEPPELPTEPDAFMDEDAALSDEESVVTPVADDFEVLDIQTEDNADDVSADALNEASLESILNSESLDVNLNDMMNDDALEGFINSIEMQSELSE